MLEKCREWGWVCLTWVMAGLAALALLPALPQVPPHRLREKQNLLTTSRLPFASLHKQCQLLTCCGTLKRT